MRNFQGFAFMWTQTYREIFKSVLMCINVQGQFLNERGLDSFSIICTKIFDKDAPKKSDIYDITISISL